MRGVTVCVDLHDEFAVTLPRNRYHFSDFMVITAPDDKRTQELALAHNCQVFTTDVFWKDGEFRKWAALEAGLDAFGRDASVEDRWLCLIDCDILLPLKILWTPEKDYLYVPYRRMIPYVTLLPEVEWANFPIDTIPEYCGYCQIFHLDDVHLPPAPPWFDITLRYAGLGDSLFQARWPETHKRRPEWEVAHLGTHSLASRWFGKRCGLSSDEQAELYWKLRRLRGTVPTDQFFYERCGRAAKNVS